MKKLFQLILLGCFIGFSAQVSKATHVMGADITYTCDSAYVFSFNVTFYRDCRGVSFSNPSSSTKIRNITTGATASVTLKLESIQDVTPICSKTSKPCTPSNTNGVGTGIEAHTYSVTIDFKKTPYSAVWNSSNCKIIFETGQCCRNSAITTGAASQNFYTYAMIDLCNGFNNNSPQYASAPVALLCCNQPTFTTMGGYDYMDGDSLVYKLAKPLSAYNTAISYSGSYSYLKPFKVYDPSGSGAVNPNANPPIGLYVDSESGQMIFMPAQCDEVTVAVMDVEEWRKDTSGKYRMIGLTRRDMQFWVNVCSDNNPPILKGPYSYQIKATPCTNQQYCFNVTTDDKIFVPPPPLPKPPADTVRFGPTNLPNGVSMKILDPNAIHPTAQICVDVSKVDKSAFIGKPLTIELSALDNACPRNAVTRRVYKITFDASEVIGKLEGEIIDDKNLNCKEDSGEKPLTHQRKLSIDGNKLQYVYTDKDGKFELCLDTGKRVVTMLPDPWYTDSCGSISVKILKDSTHSTQFFSRLKDGIGGYVYSDAHSCKQGANNKPISQQMVVAQPGNHYVTTDNNGFFLFRLNPGTYKVALVNDTIRWKNQCKDTMTVTLKSGETVLTDTFFNFQKELADLALTCGLSTGGRLRRGDASKGNVFVQNKGASVIDTATIYLQTDKGLIDLTKSSGGWKDLGNGKYSYLLTNIQPKAKSWLTFMTQKTSGYKTGDTLVLHTWSDRGFYNRELDTTNNEFYSRVRIVSAYDPNDKMANPDSIFTTNDRKLTYTIRFQNEGNASAQDVVLRDTLPGNLDLSSLTMLYGSHSFDYTLEGRRLWIYFNNIQLPPKKTDPEGSIGSVTFSINLNSDIYEETIIRNRAGIYFDIEDVVLTNYQVNHFKSPIEFSDTAGIRICKSDLVEIPFHTNFIPGQNNQFILEITDSSGNYDSFKGLDTINSVGTSGKFQFMAPEFLVNNSKYAMRIRSTEPQLMCFEDAYKTNIVVDYMSKPQLQASTKDLCFGESLDISSNMVLNTNSLFVNGVEQAQNTTAKFTLNKPSDNDKIHIVQTGVAGCEIHTDTIVLAVWAVPTLQIVADSIYCSGATEATFSFNLSKSAGRGATDSVLWNFGDANSRMVAAAAKSVSHSYTKGVYQATATASNGVCSDVEVTRVYFKHEPKASIQIAKTEYCSGESVQVSHNSTTSPGNLTGQKWLFGDGDSSSDQSTSHIYDVQKTNSFNVVLKVTDNFGCEGVASTGVTINQLPHCGFTWTTGDSARQIVFTPDSTEYTGYMWSFGDGNNSTDMKPTHTYNVGKMYQVSLAVEDGNECTCDLSKDVLVQGVSVPGLDGETLRIYPNPTSGLIFIEGSITDFHSYRITDQNGRFLEESELRTPKIDAGALTNGLYYLELVGPDKVVTLPVLLKK